MKKVCWVDCETTGLDKVEQDVIQIAGIVEIDGVEQERFEFKCQPHSWDKVQAKALEIHGYSISDLKAFDPPGMAKEQVVEVLKRHVNPYDKKDKFVFAGYNSPFDYGFMEEWFKKSGDKFFRSFFKNSFGYHSELIDTYQDFLRYTRALDLNLVNHQLITAAAHFGITIQAHDAMSDISATLEIDKILREMWQVGAEAYRAGTQA